MFHPYYSTKRENMKFKTSVKRSKILAVKSNKRTIKEMYDHLGVVFLGFSVQGCSDPSPH